MMNPDLQVSHLRTLIAIAEEGSFEAAADRIGRTQSAVTQQMQKLEEMVDSPLFETRGRRRELTPVGQNLVRYARDIVSLCSHALVASGQVSESGLITIGAPQEVAEEFLPQTLAQFARHHPGIRVVIHVDRSPNLMRMLAEGRLHMTISTRRTRNFDTSSFIKLPVHWIAGVGYEHDSSRPVPLVLSDEPSMFRRIALSALDLSGMPYVERITSPSLAGVRLSIAAGLGITARTESSFFLATRTLSEADGMPPLPDVQYYLHRAPAAQSRASQQLHDMLLERV